MTPTSFKQVTDNATSTTATVLLSTGVTSITVGVGDGAKYPVTGVGFFLTLWDSITYASPAQDPNMEKVTCTNRTGDVMTISPTTKTHPNGVRVDLLDVAQNTTDIQVAVNKLESLELVSATTQTSNFTAVAGNYYPVDATSGNITVTFPASTAGQQLSVKKIDATTNTVSAGGITLRLQNEAKTFIANVSSGWSAYSGDLSLTALDNHYAPVFNVKQYGAKGDNSTDDLAAINLAIAAAAARGGGIIYFPFGRYRISDTILITTPYIALRGDSYNRDFSDFPTVYPGGVGSSSPTYQYGSATIQVRSGFPAGHPLVQVGLLASSSSDPNAYDLLSCSMENLCLCGSVARPVTQGTRLAGYGILCLQAHDFRCINVCAEDINGSGIYMDSATPGGTSTAEVSRCLVRETSSYGIYFGAHMLDGNIIQGNFVADVTGFGIVCLGEKNFVHDNNIAGVVPLSGDTLPFSGSGIIVTGDAQKVNNNTITSTSYHGIYLSGSRLVTCIGNTVEACNSGNNSDGSGIVINGPSMTVVGNTLGVVGAGGHMKYGIHDTSGSGLDGNGRYSGSVISDNNIYNWETAPVKIDHDFASQISDNFGINPRKGFYYNGVSGAITVDRINGDFHIVLMSGDVVVTVNDGYSFGDLLTLLFVQDGAGGHNVTFSGGHLKFDGNTFKTTLAANAIDSLTFGCYIQNFKGWSEIARTTSTVNKEFSSQIYLDGGLKINPNGTPSTITADNSNLTITAPTNVYIAPTSNDGTRIELGTGSIRIGGPGQLTAAARFTGSTSGSTNLLASAVASGTLTLPATTDTLVGKATTDTFTNKSISGSTNTLISIPLGSAVTGTLVIANGGTGQTTAGAAFNALSPNTTLGDVTYGSGTNTSTRLAGNTSSTKQFLTQTGTGSVSAAPIWAAIVAGDIPTLNQSTTGNAATATTASGLTSATTTVGVSAATAPSSGQVLTATSSTTATWQTPASGFANPMTTAGDTIYGGTGGTATRLAAGTSSQVHIGGTVPSWGSIDLTAMVGSSILPVANGGTGSATQNFVDLSSAQSAIAGLKTFTGGVTVNSQALFTGSFTEATTTAGLYTGYFSSNPRVLFANGTAAQNWEIDNNGGTFRWYQPGTVYMSLTTGGLTITGGNTVSGTIAANGGISMGDTKNIAINTTTGTKIGTGTTQKIGFWNATPVVQQTGDVATALSTLGLVASPTVSSSRVVGAGTAPTIAAGTGAGTSPTLALTGHDTAGQISVTTGTLPTGGATVFTVTFNTAYSSAPYVTFSAANANAAALSGLTMVYVTSTTTTFLFTVGATGLTAATQYIWNYHSNG